MAEYYNSGNQIFSDIFKQIIFEDPKEVSKKETGQRIAEKIFSQQTGQANNLNFFTARAIKWQEIEKWVLGKQDMKQFLPFMGVSDANKSYAQIDLTPIMIMPQFVNTIVESMAKDEEYPQVSCIDADSVDEKEDRKLEAIFRMKEVAAINEMQQQSGMMLESPNAYVPDDELSAEIYFEMEDRLPKEIKFEKILENTLVKNQYERVLKRRNIHDIITFNLTCTKVEKVDKEYIIKKCSPKNVFYNFFISDTGKSELEYIGEVYNLKAKDIRKKYGASKDNPKGLTEEEIIELVKSSSSQNPITNTNNIWGQQYSGVVNNAPYDDFSVYVIDFEIRISVPEYYVSKTDNYGKENITPKKSIPQPTSDRAKVLKTNKDKIYRCVYAPYAKKILYWGLPDIVMSEPLFSYSINIPSNTGEYIPSLAERALEPVREYALTKLKRKLLISMVSPSQYRIDVESARNVTVSSGQTIDWEEIVRIKTLTGVELWSSKGLNPMERESPPFSQSTHDVTIQNIIELTNILNSIENEIRSLIGASIYLDGSKLPDRTSNQLAETQINSANNSLSFIQNAHIQVMEETLYKVCLLSWQDVIKEEPESAKDLINTKFKVYVKMKQTVYERELLERDIALWSKTLDGNGMPLLSPNDCFAIRQIKNTKLAEKYLANKIDENRRKAEQERQQRENANMQAQSQSNEQAAQKAIQLQNDKLKTDEILLELQGRNQKENILLEKGLDIYKTLLSAPKQDKNVMSELPQMPKELQDLLSMTFRSVALSLNQEIAKTEEEMQDEEMERQQKRQQQQAMQQQQMQEQQDEYDMGNGNEQMGQDVNNVNEENAGELPQDILEQVKL